MRSAKRSEVPRHLLPRQEAGDGDDEYVIYCNTMLSMPPHRDFNNSGVVIRRFSHRAGVPGYDTI